MTHWTKSLLAGTAALALAASPALAQGAGTAGASGGAAGAASGTTMDSGPGGGGAMRGSADTMDGDMQGDITGSIRSGDTITRQLNQLGYTDVQEKDAGGTTRSTYTARDTTGGKVELIVDASSGQLIREAPLQGKNQ